MHPVVIGTRQCLALKCTYLDVGWRAMFLVISDVMQHIKSDVERRNVSCIW